MNRFYAVCIIAVITFIIECFLAVEFFANLEFSMLVAMVVTLIFGIIASVIFAFDM